MSGQIRKEKKNDTTRARAHAPQIFTDTHTHYTPFDSAAGKNNQ